MADSGREIEKMQTRAEIQTICESARAHAVRTRRSEFIRIEKGSGFLFRSPQDGRLCGDNYLFEFYPDGRADYFMRRPDGYYETMTACATPIEADELDQKAGTNE